MRKVISDALFALFVLPLLVLIIAGAAIADMLELAEKTDDALRRWAETERDTCHDQN